MALRRLLQIGQHIRPTSRLTFSGVNSSFRAQTLRNVNIAAFSTKTVSNPHIRKFKSPADMQKDIDSLTSSTDVVRNYVGVIENMSSEQLVVETQLFPRESLDFYTRYNLCQTTEADKTSHSKYYTAARGGAQGDYRKDIEKKIENVVHCLTRFPSSKRAFLTIAPLSTDHTSDGDAKCLRELHFYLENDKLSCSGFMRAQAASIFPKNIHLIGTIMHQIAQRLNKKVGSYTHFVTTLVSAREK
jgi:thymidylate synthase